MTSNENLYIAGVGKERVSETNNLDQLKADVESHSILNNTNLKEYIISCTTKIKHIEETNEGVYIINYITNYNHFEEFENEQYGENIPVSGNSRYN